MRRRRLIRELYQDRAGDEDNDWKGANFTHEFPPYLLPVIRLKIKG